MTNEPNNGKQEELTPPEEKTSEAETLEADASEAETTEADTPEAESPEKSAQTPELIEDYVVPFMNRKHKDNDNRTQPQHSAEDDLDDYIYTRYHGSRTNNYTSYKNGNSNVYSASDNANRKKRTNKKAKAPSRFSRRPWWQKLLIILALIFGGILAIILLLCVVLLILNNAGIVKLTDYSNLNMTAPVVEGVDVSVSDSGKTVTYKGETYIFDVDMTSILCIGVDKGAYEMTDTVIGKAGQGDALYLIAFNTKTGKTDVIGISRDIVTDVGVYSTEEEYLGTEKMQICLAFAYGDGAETSCRNTVTAVSRLFYQLPINSYFAMNLDAITDLNDAVGGVTVTAAGDFCDSNNIYHYKGETLTLYGEDAVSYLRQRDITVLESSFDRMQRQLNYLESFSKKALSMTKQDLSVPLDLYNIVSDNSTTNLTPSTITAFAACLVTQGIEELEFSYIPGEITSDGTYAEYVVDEEAFYEMVLDIYYDKVE
ncbi:MAG: LCP family protein [Ruminococcus sp.]